jgi:hypothetical protein
MLRTVIIATLALAAVQPADLRAGPFQQAPVRVVTTLPVYASLVREIGGAEVEVSAIADPTEDAHFVRPKPSFALDLRRADAFVTTGLDLELWVPTLLDRAGNADVLEGGRGYITAYTGISLLDIPTAADRSAGDVHVYGNPHLTTDPLRALQVARNITVGLKRVAPDRPHGSIRGSRASRTAPTRSSSVIVSSSCWAGRPWSSSRSTVPCSTSWRPMSSEECGSSTSWAAGSRKPKCSGADRSSATTRTGPTSRTALE